MKEQILHKATELFLNLGFKSVTMDDIATEMGISKKTIYSHYAHKGDLISEVSVHVFDTISVGIDAIVEQRMNPIEELYEIKKYVLQHLRDEKSSPFQQLQKYYPQVHHDLKFRQFDYMQECMVNNIARGMEEGLFRDNLDVEFVSRIYFIGMMGIKDNTIFPPGAYPAIELHEAYLEYHLRGIVTPDGRKILNQLIHSNID